MAAITGLAVINLKCRMSLRDEDDQYLIAAAHGYIATYCSQLHSGHPSFKTGDYPTAGSRRAADSNVSAARGLLDVRYRGS